MLCKFIDNRDTIKFSQLANINAHTICVVCNIDKMLLSTFEMPYNTLFEHINKSETLPSIQYSCVVAIK